MGPELTPAGASAGVATAAPHERAGDVRARLAARPPGGGEVVVVDAGRPLGLVGLDVLIASDDPTPMGELLRPAPVVAAGAGREQAAAAAARAGERAVIVADGAGRLVGVLPPERLIATLFEEHEEDLARLAGSLAGASAARSAAEESVGRRLWHRLPWLAIGLAGAMLSAALVGAFEHELQDEVLLAFFVPAVVYLADAVGTQTETLVIRGMSLGVPVSRVARRELLTGLIIGVLAAAAFFVFADAVWGDARVAAVVSLSLLVSASLATAVAMLLPAGLALLGRDPAYGSGPLATVIQDLLSIASYFAIAAALLP